MNALEPSRRTALAALVALLLGASCTVDVPNGIFGCSRDDECPSGWVCRGDGRCWSTPAGAADAEPAPGQDAAQGGIDATPGAPDAIPSGPDATPGAPDASPTSDDAAAAADASATNEDAAPANDASATADASASADAEPDSGVDGGPCAPNAGQSCTGPGLCNPMIDCSGQCTGPAAPRCACAAASCTATGWACSDPADFGQACDTQSRCGATIDCSGQCVGGTAPPRCSCGTSVCQGDGQWSACVEPPNFGQACSTQTICGGTIDCTGACAGGSAAPTCPCAAATCDTLTGQWSACQTPAGFGDACSTGQTCGGQIDCNGSCSGGTAPAACPQCGTSSCDGCMGGPQCLSPRAMCALDGTCQCTTNECACNGPNQTCGRCVNGSVGACNVDQYSCGDFTPTFACNFGCDPVRTDRCACSPNNGQACVFQTCHCSCGDVDRPGAVQCDGSCSPTGPSCATLCRRQCP